MSDTPIIYSYEEFLHDLETKGFSSIDIEELLTYAEEGILQNFFIRVINLFRGTFHNVITDLTRIFKTLKRSELQYANHSKKHSINAIHNVPYLNIVNLSTPVPRGMVGTYMQTGNALSDILNTLDMQSRMEAMKNNIEDLYDNRESDEQKISNIITRIDSTTDKKNYKTLITALNKIDNPKITKLERPFGDLFGSMNDLKNTNTKLLLLDKEYDLFNSSIRTADKIEDKIDKLLNDSQAFDKVNKKYIDMLARTLFTFGETFEFYGKNILILQRTQHNLVEVYKTIAKHKKIAW